MSATKGQRPTQNPHNQALRDRRNQLSRAIRLPLTPGCLDDAPAGSAAASPLLLPPTPTQKRKSLLHVPFAVSTAGDNVLIPIITGRKLIYEIVLWNVGAQTLTFWQGPSANGIVMLKLSGFPALTQFVLAFNGSFEMPHFEIDNNKPLVLNLGAATEVDGFINYRLASNHF